MQNLLVIWCVLVASLAIIALLAIDDLVYLPGPLYGR